MRRVVALTGNIASGKSTVGRMLAELGADRIDTDAISREVTAPGSPLLEQIVRHFGVDVLTPEGHLDRAALGRIVFADPEARRRLESLTHPAIMQRVGERIAASRAPVVVVEIPLLFETGLERLFPDTILVVAPDEVRRRRLAERDGLPPEEIERRLAAQMPQEEKIARARWVLYNDADLETLRRRVHELWAELTGSRPPTAVEPADRAD